VSTADYWGDQAVIDHQLNQLGTLSGKPLSMGGMFIDIEDSNPEYNISTQLNKLLNNGYTGFMHLTSHRTLAEILSGSMDKALKKFAQSYAKWVAQGEDRSAWIAPLPEMNGTWEAYSADSQSFKQAYRHIQQIFQAAGVPKQSLRWVFAPNGWSPSDRAFESFYPGAEFVDAVAFSAYNWGYAETAAHKGWQTPVEVFDPYIQRMRIMAPDKPIFMTQMATTSITATGSSPEAKDQWLQDAYTYLAGASGVRGILYFNLNKETDWSLFNATGGLYQGYKVGVQSSVFDYVSPADLTKSLS
jgi:Glycosyl hydrolase family 26